MIPLRVLATAYGHVIYPPFRFLTFAQTLVKKKIARDILVQHQAVISIRAVIYKLSLWFINDK